VRHDSQSYFPNLPQKSKPSSFASTNNNILS